MMQERSFGVSLVKKDSRTDEEWQVVKSIIEADHRKYFYASECIVIV